MKGKKPAKKQPTQRQRRVAALILANPTWPFSQILREAGYSEGEARHAAKEVLERSGTQEAMADLRVLFRKQLAEKITVTRAVDKLSVLLDARRPFGKEGDLSDDNPVQLSACKTILEYLGLVETQERTAIITTVITMYNQELVPVLLRFVDPTKGELLVAELQALGGRFTADSGERLGRPAAMDTQAIASPA